METRDQSGEKETGGPAPPATANHRYDHAIDGAKSFNTCLSEAFIRRLEMFKTKNDLSETTRVKAVELLNARLADCKDLQTQTKQAHWNVKGPNFIALHELFDKINDDVEEYVDEIAERAVQLGGVAEGTARMVAKRSSLAEYPANISDGRSHVEALSAALAVFGKAARKAIGEANDLGDLDTADLFTEVSRGIDKWLWFVEAHLQAER
jgi:starvation-inducible DNA-binding protein